MVMGPTHAMSGAAAYMSVASFAGTITATFATESPAVFVMGMLVTTGAALYPDWDSYTSTVTNSFGFIGRLLYRAANALSLTVYNVTRTRYDQPKENGHRTLFHTGVMAIVAGLLVSFLGSLGGTVDIRGHLLTWGQVSSLAFMFVFLHLALAGLFEQARSIRKKYGPYVMMLISAVITLIIASFLPEDQTYPWLGACVGLGWFVHLLGDAITKMGVPLLFPIKIRGKRWYDITLPSFLRITAGGKFEKIVLLPALTAATGFLVFYQVPGVRDLVAQIMS